MHAIRPSGHHASSSVHRHVSCHHFEALRSLSCRAVSMADMSVCLEIAHKAWEESAPYTSTGLAQASSLKPLTHTTWRQRLQICAPLGHSQITTVYQEPPPNKPSNWNVRKRTCPSRVSPKRTRPGLPAKHVPGHHICFGLTHGNGNDYMMPLWPPGQFGGPKWDDMQSTHVCKPKPVPPGRVLAVATGKTPEQCPWRCRSARPCLGASGLGLALAYCQGCEQPVPHQLEGPAPQTATQTNRQKQRSTPRRWGRGTGKTRSPGNTLAS